MDNIEDKLAEIRDLLANDRLEEAEQRLQQIDSIAINNPDIHLELARLYEEAGMISLLIRELNLALRDAPDNTDILRQLAEVYTDSGQPEKAARCWKQVIKSELDNAKAYEELGNILIEQKNYEEARQVYQQGSLIKLPLGIHRRSGKRALFVTPPGEPYENQLQFLQRVGKVGRKDLMNKGLRQAAANAAEGKESSDQGF